MQAQLIAGAVIVAMAFAGGWKVNEYRHDSLELMAQKSAEAVADRSVEAIKKIRVQNVTIKQQAETVTREVVSYRDGTCVHDKRVLDSLNQALAGPPGAGAGVPADVRPAR